jgi:hypothetical protein
MAYLLRTLAYIGAIALVIGVSFGLGLGLVELAKISEWFLLLPIAAIVILFAAVLAYRKDG